MLTIYFIFLLPLLCIYFFCLACLWIKVFFLIFFFLTFLFHFPYCSLTTYDFFHSFLVADLVITVLSLDLLTCHVHWWSSSPTVPAPGVLLPFTRLLCAVSVTVYVDLRDTVVIVHAVSSHTLTPGCPAAEASLVCTPSCRSWSFCLRKFC